VALAADATKAIDALPAGVGDPTEVFRKAVHAAMRGVDPHFRYIDARALGQERSEAAGVFGGLGLEVESGGGAVRIVAPTPGGPAERAGLVAGEVVLSVDGRSVAGVPLADAIARMRGQPGTPVSLTVRRSGADDERTVTLVREAIRREVLRTRMEDDVLVLRLGGFTDAVSASLEQAVVRAAAERSPRAVVLDLRGNPGGLFREAVRISDAFLGAGDIVSLRGNTPGRDRTWQADANELLPGVPMVVLIDRRSASASELVADALQQNRRATVLGQRSYGKGSVQTTIPLGEDAGAIKLTTALYHGPSGRTVHRIGVEPDIELVEAAATDTAPGASAATARARVDPARCTTGAPVPDPTLACALRFLRTAGIDAFLAEVGTAR
jgi:carboxyl-terminal processing protease